MKKWAWLLILPLLLAGCGQPPEEVPTTCPTETRAPTQTTAPPQTQPPVITGWVEENGRRYYYNSDGTPHTGWLRHYGESYYFHPDGTMAVGEVIIDGKAFHFSSQGKRVILVNPWNYIPEDYDPILVAVGRAYAVENTQVDVRCYEDLVAMIRDCNRVCPEVCIVSSYRTHEYQIWNHNRKIQSYVDQGYSLSDAKVAAAAIVAVPGTSEHELGLAVDIIDTRLWKLSWDQAELPGQKWLMENSWRYGFILRYPQDKREITGIIYEPWHYRYVGKEVAAELHKSGLTLEEYFQSLTQ